jgi:predicted ArsR family transcriptional regulator
MTRPAAPPRTRRAILDLLMSDGPLDAGDLARALGVGAIAIRQHLRELERAGLAAHETRRRPRGRPVRAWSLTPEADAFFPDAHGALVVDLLGALRRGRGVERVLSIRERRQVAAYRRRVPKRGSLRARVEALARIRTEEGYMASVRDPGDGTLELRENHCPICAAARACPRLCSSELDVFAAVLGEGVDVARTEHILDGARRCVYAVRRSRSE